MNSSASGPGDLVPWPRPGYAWYVVTILFVCSVFSFLDRQVIALMVEDIKLDLGLNDFEIAKLVVESRYQHFELCVKALSREMSRRFSPREQ